MINAHNIPPNVIINWDQAGVKLVPSQNWTKEEKGSTHLEIAHFNDKHQITLTLAGSLSEELLPLNFSIKKKLIDVIRSIIFHPNFWHTPNYWANKETTLRFIKQIIIPYVLAVRTKKPS